jgi:hypothetical protein
LFPTTINLFKNAMLERIGSNDEAVMPESNDWPGIE